MIPDWMQTVFDACGCDAPQIDRCAQYLALLQKWNSVHRLIGPSDADTMWDKHIADALLTLPIVESMHRPETIVDIGSGAGLPGLVWAIARPAWQVHLLDPLHKRIAFCQTAARELALANVRVHCGRAEDEAMQQAIGCVDTIVSRATWALAEYLPLAAPFAVSGGAIVALKGARWDEEMRAAENVLSEQKLTLRGFSDYTLPRSAAPRRCGVFVTSL